MRLVIIGGSASATPELADALVAWPGGAERRPPMEVVLTARSAERLALVAGEMRRRLAAGPGAAVTVTTQTELAAALDGADIVLNAVRIGGLAARVFDESFPQRHGVPGEETMGPGGFANAARTVPALGPMWEAVAERAPGALIINLTNPAGIVVAAARRQAGLDLFAVCDSPVAFCDSIAARLGVAAGEIRRRYQGMNHLGWWHPQDEAQFHETIDLALGQEREAVLAQGAIGAPYVRYYLDPEPILERQRSAHEVRAQQLLRLESDLLAGYSAGATDLPRRGAVWYGLALLPLVDAWFNGSSETLLVGMRNDGRIAGLPADVVTETAVRIERPGEVATLPADPLPTLPAAILAHHAAYESLAVEAVLSNGSREAHIRALLANPMVGTYQLAAALAHEIEAGSPS